MPNATKPPTTSSSNISSSADADTVKLVMNDPAVNVALQRGNKIEAIRLVRIATGLGLKESKNLVEQHLSGVSVGDIAPPPPPLDAAAVLKDQELVWLMERGNKIGAMGRRELTGVGLKEAKDAVRRW